MSFDAGLSSCLLEQIDPFNKEQITSSVSFFIFVLFIYLSIYVKIC